jgi:hypothetical protein
MRNFKVWMLGVIALVISFGGVALAADAIDPSTGSADLAKSIYAAFAGGHYAYCASLFAILAVALTKRYLGPRVPWLHSDVGGTSLVLTGSVATAMAAGLAGGGPLTYALAKSALLVGIGAAGGFTVLKRLVIEPVLRPLAARAPAWMQPIFSMILWIFDKPDPIGAAEQAGNAATAAAPAAGAASTVGSSTEVS